MSEKYLLKDGVEAYLKKLEDDGASPTTRATYARCLAIAVAHFGEEKDLRRLIAAHVSGYFKGSSVNRKPDGSARAPLSISQIKRVFRQAIAFAHESGRIDAVPMPKGEQERG